MSFKKIKITDLFSRPEPLYALLSLIAFAPCLLTGQAYFDNDLLAQFGPWRSFLKEQLSSGHFPLWNPYLMGGTPFFADPQNMMLYPFNWPTLPFSVPTGLTLFFLLHMFWAGLGTHLWLRSLKLSEKACRIGGLTFALSGFFWMELIHPPVLASFAWLPWLFCSLEKLATDLAPRRAFTAGLAFAMLFLCGSFQVFLGGLYGGLAYFIHRAWPLPGLRPDRGSLAVAALFLWGALPLLGQFIPTAEFSALTNRRTPSSSNERSNDQLSLSPDSLHQLVFPRFPLKPGESVPEALQSLDSSKNLWPMLGYVGVWAPFLAFLALRGKRRPALLFLALFAGTGLAISLGRNLPLHWVLDHLLPGLSLIRVPFRYLFLFTLGMSALVSFGYEAWASRKPRPGDLGFFKGALVYAFLLYLIALWRPTRDWRELLALGSGLVGLFLYQYAKQLRAKGELLFQTALILPLLLSGWACFKPGSQANFDFQVNSRSLVELASSLGPERVVFGNGAYYPIEVGGKKYALPYPQNAACALDLKNFGGYNPLGLRTKADLAGLPLSTAVKLGAFRGILSQSASFNFEGFTRRSIPPYQFYEWKGPLPYAFVPRDLKVEPDPTQRLKKMSAPDFDPYVTGLLDRAWIYHRPGSDESWQEGPTKWEASLVSDSVDRQVFDVSLDRDKLMVFCETMFPGWTATVDGEPKSIYTADHFLRSIFLTKGHHRVEFRFEPSWWPGIPLGLGLWSLLTLVGLTLSQKRGGRSRG